MRRITALRWLVCWSYLRDVVWLGKYIKGLRDDKEQESESDIDSDSEDENEDLETTTNESEEPVQVSTLRTTRSGVRFAPVEESILDKKDENKKVHREMQKFSTFFNPEASRAVEKSKNEPPNNPPLQQNAL